MKTIQWVLLSTIILFTIATQAARAEEPLDKSDVPSVDEIVNKANLMAYYQGQDGKSSVSMKITDKSGNVRTRQFNILRKNDQLGGDQKYYVYFLQPPDVRRMVFMVHKHTALDKDDDRWLYLPSLDLVNRIAASDKRTSFVGSDFLYEDVSGRGLEEDTHELAEVTDEFFVVKNLPKDPASVEFKFFTVRIDRKTYLPVRMEFFDKADTLYRTIESLKVEPIKAKEGDKEAEYITTTESVVKDLKSGSMTEMTFSNVQYNIGISDDIFTERYLRRPPREAMR
jgi:outer membrane lipoprotein-sorting protein